MFDRKSKKQPAPPVSNPEVNPRRTTASTPSTGRSVEPMPDPPLRGSPAQQTSALNPNISVEGNLSFHGTLVVNCKVQGSIVSEGRLVIGSSAVVDADVTAGTIEISGKVKGDVTAQTSVKINTGAEVVGDIETPTISMEEGVAFEGRCTRPVVQEVVEPLEDSQDTVRSDDEETDGVKQGVEEEVGEEQEEKQPQEA